MVTYIEYGSKTKKRKSLISIIFWLIVAAVIYHIITSPGFISFVIAVLITYLLYKYFTKPNEDEDHKIREMKDKLSDIKNEEYELLKLKRVLERRKARIESLISRYPDKASQLKNELNKIENRLQKIELELNELKRIESILKDKIEENLVEKACIRARELIDEISGFIEMHEALEVGKYE